jgi:hypothetical protein
MTSICQRRKGAGHLGCSRVEPVWWATAFRSRRIFSVWKRKKDQEKERGWLGGPQRLPTAGVVRAARKALEKGSNGLS